MATPARQPTLAGQHLRWLAGLFLLLEGVTIASTLVFVLWPMARRSADDLAGLMVLSAQTWAELPPETRPVFQAELIRTHQIALQLDLSPGGDGLASHGFYIAFLERALAARQDASGDLIRRPGPDAREWLWARVDAGGRTIGVGIPTARMDTRPFQALAVTLLVGSCLVGVAAWWLARRIAQPVARLERAAEQLAAGARPDLLPRDGPRELSQLAGHFNDMALQVRELIDARTTLFAGLSHDLRTPLARMRLALEMLTLRPEPRLIERLEHDIEEMNALIGQLLDLARGLDRARHADIDLEVWLRRRAEAKAAEAERTGSTIEVRCGPGLRLRTADGLLGRVVDNLLGNALAHAPGPIELHAHRWNNAEGVPMVRLQVLDRGPGIPADQLDAMWRPFERLDASRRRATGGYGLGLAIVRQLTRAQGWTATLGARDGGGLVATVEWPWVAPEAGADDAGAVVPDRPAATDA